ncbi:MAG: AAA family ATPase [Candidatus Azobacteroides sp.]|nr:AAA family ATPase [Candidatus Azobacteroides sp.]
MSKKVTIKQITLVNFKGIKSLTVNFGQVTEIRGANATGKSTIADAFNWVLFGKDVAGNSDSKFGIKTVDFTGKVIEKLDHEVTAILDIDGETAELRRVYSEDWVTPRGKAESELKGHTTSYFYNGVPLKESEYKIKINSIIDEDLFRMLTSPLYFPRLDWQVQREILLKIAGNITLEEIAAGRSEFSELLAKLSGKSLAEIKAEISARKKKIKEALDLIPARIDEVTRATPVAPDYKALEAEKTEIEKSIEATEMAMRNAAESARAEYETQAEIQREINAQKNIQSQVIFNAIQKSKEEWNNRNAAANEARAKLISLQRESESTFAMRSREINALKNDMESRKSRLKEIENRIELKRADWFYQNALQYDPSNSICPACGQEYPIMQAEAKKEDFEKHKAESLRKITEEGQQLTDEKEILTADIEANTKLIRESENITEKEKNDFTEQIKALQAQTEANPQEPYIEPTPEEIPEYVKATEQIDILSKQLETGPATGDTIELTSKKKELTEQSDEIKRQLGLKAIIEANENRKAELLREEKDLARQKADLEKQEFTADSLVKEQMNEVERRVNLRFKSVRFKMYSPQINGGEKPDCILIGPDGAKFTDTNSAEKIAMGLDIINTLCEFNGVYAPVFIDNAEGINRIFPVNSQLIKLIVTQDKELIIK